MGIILRTAEFSDKKIKLTKDELTWLAKWLEISTTAAFSGKHWYKDHAQREELYKYSLLTLREKIANKLINFFHQLDSKKVTTALNYAEQKTLLVMFERVGTGQYMLAVQQKIIFQLRPLKRLTGM